MPLSGARSGIKRHGPVSDWGGAYQEHTLARKSQFVWYNNVQHRYNYSQRCEAELLLTLGDQR